MKKKTQEKLLKIVKNNYDNIAKDFAFKNKTVNYTGFDNSKELIKLAKGNFPKHKFIVDNIIEMTNISNNAFDWIFSIAVLHHIPDKKLRIKTLQNLKKKLKNNGKLVITVWNLWDYKDFKLKIIKFYLTNLFTKNKVEFGDFIFDWKGGGGNNHKKRYYHAFTVKSFKKIIKKSGLKIEKVEKDKFNYCFILKK